MRKLKDDKRIKWTESYTEKTRFLKDMYHDIIGPKSYFRFEGKEIGGSDEWYVIVSPSGVKEHEKKWFAGIRKLPDKWPAGGKKFDSITDAFSYANDTWGVPHPKSLPHYTMTDLKNVAGRESEWRDERESEEVKKSSALLLRNIKLAMNKLSMAKGAVSKCGMALHSSTIESIVGPEVARVVDFQDRTLSGLERVSRICVGVRRGLMYRAASIISNLHSIPSSIGIRHAYGDLTAADSEGMDRNVEIVDAYDKYVTSLNYTDTKLSPVVKSDDIENCLTWNNVYNPSSRSSAGLSDNGMKIRKVFYDVFRSLPEESKAGISPSNGEQVENCVMLSNMSENAMILASAVSCIAHIQKSNLAVDNLRRRGGNSSYFADIVSLSQIERSFIWLHSEVGRQNQRYAEMYREATGVPMPSGHQIPSDMFLEIGRTDDRLRAILVGPYISKRDYKNMNNYRITESYCQNLSRVVRVSVDELVRYARDNEIFDVDLSKSQALVFFKHFHVPEEYWPQAAYEDIPVARDSRSGVISVRARGGNHKKRIYETIGSWYCGNLALPEEDPVDNDLFDAVLLRPRMVRTEALIAAMRSNGLDDMVSKIPPASPLITYEQYLSFLNFTNDNAKETGVEDVFLSCPNILSENVIPSVGKDGISPSVKFEPIGYLKSLRYVVGGKWKMKEYCKEVYRNLLSDIHMAFNGNLGPQSSDINDFEALVDSLLASSSANLHANYFTFNYHYAKSLTNTDSSSIRIISARSFDGDLMEIYNASIFIKLSGDTSGGDGREMSEIPVYYNSADGAVVAWEKVEQQPPLAAAVEPPADGESGSTPSVAEQTPQSDKQRLIEQLKRMEPSSGAGEQEANELARGIAGLKDGDTVKTVKGTFSHPGIYEIVSFNSNGTMRLKTVTRLLGDDSGRAWNALTGAYGTNGSGILVKLRSGFKISGRGDGKKREDLPQNAIIMTSRGRAFPFTDIFRNGARISDVAFASDKGVLYYNVMLSDVRINTKKIKSEINNFMESAGNSFRLTSYDPGMGSANSFTNLKKDKNEKRGVGVINEQSPLLDQVVVGDATYGEFLEAVSSGWFGETPIAAHYDNEGNASFPFASSEKMSSSGTRQIRLSANNGVAAQLRSIMGRVNNARGLILRLTGLVAELGFWWKGDNDQPSMQISRIVRRRRVERSFPLKDFLNLDVADVRNIHSADSRPVSSGLLEAMMSGRDFGGQAMTDGLSYGKLQNAVSLSVRAARTLTSSIILNDIQSGMINRILTRGDGARVPDILRIIGIQSSDQVIGNIPGAGSNDIAHNFSDTMCYNETQDQIDPADVARQLEEDRREQEEQSDSEDVDSTGEDDSESGDPSDGEEAVIHEEAAPIQEDTSAPVADAGQPPTAEPTVSQEEEDEDVLGDYSDVEASNQEHLDDLRGVHHPVESPAPVQDRPAAMQEQPLQTPSVTQSQPEPSSQDEDGDEDEEKIGKMTREELMKYILSSSLIDVGGIIKDSARRLSNLASSLPDGGKIVSSMEINRIIKKATDLRGKTNDQ